MSPEEKITTVLQRNAQPIRVRLTRGQRGTYAWEIEHASDNADSILYTLDYIDSRLRECYIVERTEAKPSKPESKVDVDDVLKEADEVLRRYKAERGEPTRPEVNMPK